MSINVLDFVTEPATATDGFHGILYGPSGCGKTSTLDDEGFKVLDIDLEGGTAVLNGAPTVKRIDIPDMARRSGISKYRAFLEVGKAIESGKFKDYDLIGIDSLTAFQEIVKEYVATEFAPNRKREIQGKFGATADWGDLSSLITKTVRWFHEFTKRGKDSVHVLWIAHVAEDKDEVTSQVTGTKVQLQGSQTPYVVMSAVDGYFYMATKSVPPEGGKGEPTIERAIFTKPWGIYAAKARQPKRQDALPAVIKDPKWSEIFTQLGYTRS